METNAPRAAFPPAQPIEGTKPKRQQAVKAELQAESVKQTERSPASRTLEDNAAQRAERQAQLEQIIQDRSRTEVSTELFTSSMVVQTIASDSDSVLHQFPAENILKLRAYTKQADLAAQIRKLGS